MGDIFDRLSIEEKDIFSRIKLDLFDKVELELSDILEKKLELTEEVRNYIRKQIEKVTDELIQKNVARIKVDSLTRQDVKSLVETSLKGTAKENEVEEEIEKAKKEIKEEVEKLLKELRKKNAAMMNDFYSKSGNFYQFGGYRLTVTEEDGSPSGIPTTLKFSNGSVTNNGDGSFSISNSSPAAPVDAKYVTLDVNATLTEERVLTGTTNQIIVTDNGAGSTVVLSTPQDIATTSSPTFNGLTLTTPLPIASGGTGQVTATAAFNALDPLTTLGDMLYHNGTDSVRLAGNTTTSKNFLTQTGDGVASAAPGWETLDDADIPATVVRTSLTLTAGAGLTGGGDLSANRTFDVGAGTGITVNANDVALTIPVAVTSGGTGQTTYTNGQLLIGNTTGNTLTKTTLTGTTNQITVTNGTGSITLSTPQDIATTSSPTFSGLILSVVTKTGTYSILASDYVILCNTAPGSFSVTLPTAVGRTGQMYHIKKINSSINNVTIATTSSQTIDGDTSVVITTQYESYMVISDGANWSIL